MTAARIAVAVAATALLAGCVTPPPGPQIPVMPPPYKPFAVFQDDQAICGQYARSQVAGGAEAANNRQVGTAVVGTVLGAGLGAIVGGGRGAVIGAGTGAVVGTAVGSGPAASAQYSLQQRYDWAYGQCMYSRGNNVSGYPPIGAAPPPPPPRAW